MFSWNWETQHWDELGSLELCGKQQATMKKFFSGGEKPKATELPKTVLGPSLFDFIFYFLFSLLFIGQNIEVTRCPWTEEFLGLNQIEW